MDPHIRNPHWRTRNLTFRIASFRNFDRFVRANPFGRISFLLASIRFGPLRLPSRFATIGDCAMGLVDGNRYWVLADVPGACSNSGQELVAVLGRSSSSAARLCHSGTHEYHSR